MVMLKTMNFGSTAALIKMFGSILLKWNMKKYNAYCIQTRQILQH